MLIGQIHENRPCLIHLVHPRIRTGKREIDLRAVVHNLRVVRALLRPGTEVAAVVKADAYGHGAAPVALALERHGVDWFAVATVEEGLELRKHGIKGRILTLVPVLPAAVETALKNDLTLSIGSLREAKFLNRIAARLGVRARAHFMVDTGLSRGGFFASELLQALPEITSLSAVSFDGAWGHFAKVRPLSEARRRVRAFKELTDRIRGFIPLPFVHMASSQALAALPESHFDLVRPGLALYGYLPFAGAGRSLKPAMRVSAPVVAVKRYPAGTPISYEGTYVLPRASAVATIRFGYADGYEFHLGNSGHVSIGGARYPVVGRVTMDQMLVEVGDAPVVPGDRAVLLGPPGPSAEELASWSSTIPYSVLIALGRRVRKVWRYDPQKSPETETVEIQERSSSAPRPLTTSKRSAKEPMIPAMRRKTTSSVLFSEPVPSGSFFRGRDSF